jgi:dihydroorotase
LLEDGKISEIGNIENAGDDYEIIEGDLICTPGLFDMHVHFRDPGQNDDEDIISGIESAKNGGFTGALCMPNTNPPIDSVDTTEYILEKAGNSGFELHVSGCITKGRKGNEINNLEKLHKIGVNLYTDDGSGIQYSELMKDALRFSVESNVLIAQHCEDKNISSDGAVNEGRISKYLKVKGIPESSETSIIERDIEIAKGIKKSRYHVQHVSSGKSVDLIEKNKNNYFLLTSEVCPHHFILNDEHVIKYNTNAKMNPPLRTVKDVERIKKGIKDGVIDVICSDHAPHSELRKSDSLENAPFGIIGLETSFALAYTYLVKTKIITLERLIEMMSINPRKLLLQKPIRIEKGREANLSIFSLNEEWIINKDKFKSKSRNTPFNGWKVFGKPYAVICNKQIYYSDL